MKGYIEVIFVEDIDAGNTFEALVNVSQIIGVFPIVDKENMSRILYNNGQFILAKESYEDIKNKIKEELV